MYMFQHLQNVEVLVLKSARRTEVHRGPKAQSAKREAKAQAS